MSFRFWSHVDLRGDDECWPWTASRHPDGYGQFRADAPVAAHRFAYALVYGQPPRGARITHRCRDRACVNPAHLELETERNARVAREHARRALPPLPRADRDVERFWSKVAIADANSCWLWTAQQTRCGYGRFRVIGSKVLAHRYAFTITRGPIPDGLCVLHNCDTPLCVNPGHLHLGTVVQNNAERNQRGREARGERNGRARLTEADVLAIRRLLTCGRSPCAIAADLGVNSKTIYQIAHGQTWKHVIANINPERREHAFAELS